MSTLAGALGVTHSANLVRRLPAAYRTERADELRDAFEQMRRQLAVGRPDALVVTRCDQALRCATQSAQRPAPDSKGARRT
jgi:hypothetical protein